MNESEASGDGAWDRAEAEQAEAPWSAGTIAAMQVRSLASLEAGCGPGLCTSTIRLLVWTPCPGSPA